MKEYSAKSTSDAVAHEAHIEQSFLGCLVAAVIDGAVVDSDDRCGIGEAARGIVHTDEVTLSGTVVNRAVGEAQCLDIALAAVEEVAALADDIMDETVVECDSLDC